MSMKLYHATGACSLASIIAAREADIHLDLIHVDISSSPHVSADGVDFLAINPKGYVPVLRIDDGMILTEGIAILQYLNDHQAILPPVENSMSRYRLLEWLTFIATELHKSFSPWLFHPEYGQQAADVARSRIADRFSFLEKRLEAADFLLGSTFCVADAYCYSIARWAPGKGIDLAAWPALAAYLARVEARPAVRRALQHHDQA